MKGITEKEYNRRMKEIRERNTARERNRKLREERRKGIYRPKLPTTSKLILAAMIAMCAEIIIFCEWIMVKTYDTTAMYALIGIPAALAPTLWGYFSKSKAENSEGGIVYDMAMAQLDAGVDTETDEAAKG